MFLVPMFFPIAVRAFGPPMFLVLVVAAVLDWRGDLNLKTGALLYVSFFMIVFLYLWLGMHWPRKDSVGHEPTYVDQKVPVPDDRPSPFPGFSMQDTEWLQSLDPKLPK